MISPRVAATASAVLKVAACVTVFGLVMIGAGFYLASRAIELDDDEQEVLEP